ncbi:hypothetical protein [Fastidiosibacter lacustris]|uniref:hypothetical protein n=1 Tax=Fastidiosibacter lacustris TaxID=2056695 RepID=UPI000E34AC5D|nr:hypothetical protein [Fastidiosibacter lacustris]
MKVKFQGTIPKESTEFSSNEDVFCINYDNKKVVLCDGASESFAAKEWATVLANQYIESECINAEWLEKARFNYSIQFDKSDFSWSKLASYSRGSFSTLLGLTFDEDKKKVELLSIGDCIAILFDGNVKINTFHYLESCEFSHRPLLLASESKYDSFSNDDVISEINTGVWDLQHFEFPHILVMSDALGEWFLKMYERNNTSEWSQLLEIEDTESFLNLIEHNRKNNSIRLDDTTLISLKL